MRAAAWLDILRDLHRLPCADGDVSDCTGRCEDRAGSYLGDEWDGCPVRALRDDHHLLYVLRLDRQGSLAPLSDWPDGYAAWVPDLWSEVRAARDDRRAHEAGG